MQGKVHELCTVLYERRNSIDEWCVFGRVRCVQPPTGRHLKLKCKTRNLKFKRHRKTPTGWYYLTTHTNTPGIQHSPYRKSIFRKNARMKNWVFLSFNGMPDTNNPLVCSYRWFMPAVESDTQPGIVFFFYIHRESRLSVEESVPKWSKKFHGDYNLYIFNAIQSHFAYRIPVYFWKKSDFSPLILEIISCNNNARFYSICKRLISNCLQHNKHEKRMTSALSPIKKIDCKI